MEQSAFNKWAQNLSDEAKEFFGINKCRCIDVEVGSYGNQIELPAPHHIIEWASKASFSLGGERKTICIDKCLAKEVKALWGMGIITTGCCCGHNKVAAYIGVIDIHINKMKALGYNVVNNLHDNACDFKPFSI